MASAAVTATSAVDALVPFKMGLGCLPAKGDSRNFVIEWLVVFISPTYKRTEKRAPVWGSEVYFKRRRTTGGIQQKPLLG